MQAIRATTPRYLLTLALLLAMSPGPGCQGDDDDSTAPGNDDDSGDDDAADDDDVADDDDDSSGDDDSAASVELWPWCPVADEYIGDSTWTQSVEATGGALYCASFSEHRSLEEEPAFKALLRVVPGSYPLPWALGIATLALPVCFQMNDGQDPPLLDGAGNVHTSSSQFGPTTYFSHLLEQPLETAGGDTWWLSGVIRMESEVVTEPPPPLQLDGSGGAPYGGPGAEFSLCPDDPQSCSGGRRFLSCNPTSYRLQQHTVVFAGGEVILDVRMGESMAATEPAAFVRAAGSLDGQSFEQEDYWKLIYNPTHHHFSRDFAVLFDSPIGDACGLRATEVDPWGDQPPTRVHTINCKLGEIEERSVTSDTFEETPAETEK